MVILYALIFWTCWNHFNNVLTDEMIEDGVPLLIQFVIFLVFYAIVHYSSIILHEFGHLFFGLKSKLEFIAFNIRGVSIVRKNKKIIVEKNPLIRDIGGYCRMRFLDSINYSNKDVILYFYGGIIVNIVLSLIFLFIFLIFENDYIRFLSLLFVIYNFYLAIYNSIPYCNLVGVNTDMRHIVNYLHDNKYVKKIGIIEKIMKYREDNNSLRSIDKNLLYMPKKFVSDYDFMLAEIYIAYLSEIKDYKKMNDSIDYVLKNARDTINEAHKNSFKVQQIDYMIHTKIDKTRLNEIWDSSFNNYINQMTILSISGLSLKYLYYKTIENDENKSNDILNQVQNRKRKCNDMQDIQEAEQFIQDIDKCLRKDKNEKKER